MYNDNVNDGSGQTDKVKYRMSFSKFDVVPNYWGMADVVKAIHYKITANGGVNTATGAGIARLPWPEKPVPKDEAYKPGAPGSDQPAPVKLTEQQVEDGYTINDDDQVVDGAGDLVETPPEPVSTEVQTDRRVGDQAKPFVPYSQLTRSWAEEMVSKFGGDDLKAVMDGVNKSLSTEVQPHVVSKAVPFAQE